MKLHSTVEAVTARIRERSRVTRSAYLDRLAQTANRKPGAERLSCSKVARAQHHQGKKVCTHWARRG